MLKTPTSIMPTETMFKTVSCVYQKIDWNVHNRASLAINFSTQKTHINRHNLKYKNELKFEKDAHDYIFNGNINNPDGYLIQLEYDIRKALQHETNMIACEDGSIFLFTTTTIRRPVNPDFLCKDMIPFLSKESCPNFGYGDDEVALEQLSQFNNGNRSCMHTYVFHSKFGFQDKLGRGLSNLEINQSVHPLILHHQCIENLQCNINYILDNKLITLFDNVTDTIHIGQSQLISDFQKYQRIAFEKGNIIDVAKYSTIPDKNGIPFNIDPKVYSTNMVVMDPSQHLSNLRNGTESASNVSEISEVSAVGKNAVQTTFSSPLIKRLYSSDSSAAATEENIIPLADFQWNISKLENEFQPISDVSDVSEISVLENEAVDSIEKLSTAQTNCSPIPTEWYGINSRIISKSSSSSLSIDSDLTGLSGSEKTVKSISEILKTISDT